jgi:glycosyltransferase involved in cell wall biosynthesis
MIAVIIPFYKAKDFILQAVKSCNYFQIVSEVLIIYDGCPHCTFDELVMTIGYLDKVIVYHHEEFKNLGASASRNLGISKATSPYIAFLDADDYFLPNRFDFFIDKVADDSKFDGIYEAAIYEDSDKIYSVKNPSIPPKHLLHYLIRGTYGHFCTNGILVKKPLIEKAGYFDESLDIHQDSEMWLRLAYFGKLIPGSIKDAVAVIRKHEGNRFWKGTSNSSRLKQWQVTWNWAKREPIGLINKILVLRKLIRLQLAILKHNGR